jgi:hypothetical protein
MIEVIVADGNYICSLPEFRENSLGCGGNLKRLGTIETPASKRMFTLGVSIYVHNDLTPKLSEAIGVTWIF